MRDLMFESKFLTETEDLCERAYGRRNPGYTRSVIDRLEKGKETYGDGAYIDRDNLVEARFEPPDVAGYLALEIQRRRGEGWHPEDLAELEQLCRGAAAKAMDLDADLQGIQRFIHEVLTSAPRGDAAPADSATSDSGRPVEEIMYPTVSASDPGLIGPSPCGA